MQTQAKYLSFSPSRIMAIILRHLYLVVYSWPRILELAYWPLVQVMMWGFLQSFLSTQTSYFIHAAGLLLAAVMLWDTLLRGQFGFSISFLEEMWSRNIGHLLMSPLRPIELLMALALASLIRVFAGLLPVILFAYLVFDFNLFSIGAVVILFFINLFLTSWAMGMAIIGVILRFGLGAESFAWALPFFLLPFVCVYYPVDTLPPAVYYLSYCLPPTYVFEALRFLLIDNVIHYELMLYSFLLNLCYIAVGMRIFYYLLASARNLGKLLQTGE